jgi:hypothetical protein
MDKESSVDTVFSSSWIVPLNLSTTAGVDSGVGGGSFGTGLVKVIGGRGATGTGGTSSSSAAGGGMRNC